MNFNLGKALAKDTDPRHTLGVNYLANNFKGDGQLVDDKPSIKQEIGKDNWI